MIDNSRTIFTGERSWRKYLQTSPQSNHEPSDDELESAFICGFVMALHRHAIYDFDITLEDDYRTIGGGVMTKVSYYEKGGAFLCQYEPSRVGLGPHVHRFFLHSNIEELQELGYGFSNGFYDGLEISTRMAFFAGYKSALLIYQCYDRCIFMNDEDALSIIEADLILLEEEEKTALQNAKRIVCQQ